MTRNALWLLSLVVVGVGVALLPDFARFTVRHQDSFLTKLGLFAGFALLISIVVLAFRYEKSEKGARRLNRGSIKRLERAVKHMRFLQRHPSALLAFILFALVIFGGMAFVPAGHPNDREATALHVIGIVFGIPYIALLVLFLYARFTKKWETYIDLCIGQSEERLAKAKLLEGQPPA